VRVAVDLTVCQGYAQCCFLAPDVFRFSGQEALLYVPEPDDEHRLAVLRSAAACPVQAIAVDFADRAASAGDPA
jgi:ferredoxin